MIASLRAAPKQAVSCKGGAVLPHLVRCRGQPLPLLPAAAAPGGLASGGFRMSNEMINET